MPLALVQAGCLVLAELSVFFRPASRADITIAILELVLVASLVCLVYLEITGRRQSNRQALEAFEHNYRRLFEQNPQPMWVYDPETFAFIAVNDAAVRQYGYSADEFLAMTIKTIRPQEDVPALIENVRQRDAGFQRGELWRHRKKDGTVIDVEIAANDVDFGGRGARLVMATDISERLRAQRALAQSGADMRRLNAELEQRIVERTAEIESRNLEMQQSRQELREFIDSMPVFNAKVALDGTLLLVNRTAQVASGLSMEELLKIKFQDGQWWAFDPMVQARMTAAFAGAVSGTPVSCEEKLFAYGTVIDIALSLTPIAGADGKVAYIVAEARDITPLKRAERALRERGAQLEVAMAELESFSYSVSHDLRSPLRAADGFSLALEKQYGKQLDETARHYLSRIRAGTQRMDQLIDDLLKLSRISRGELRRQHVDLTGVAQRIVRELRAEEPERLVEFVIADDVSAQGDANLLTIALENLLRNAWKFTGKLGKARIEFAVAEIGNQPAYYVKDNGAGFDMAYADKLFGVFQRLHHLDEFPGTGVGLATVQRIIRRHGGRIWAESAVNQGATFHFTLDFVGYQ